MGWPNSLHKCISKSSRPNAPVAWSAPVHFLPAQATKTKQATNSHGRGCNLHETCTAPHCQEQEQLSPRQRRPTSLVMVLDACTDRASPTTDLQQPPASAAAAGAKSKQFQVYSLTMNFFKLRPTAIGQFQPVFSGLCS